MGPGPGPRARGLGPGPGANRIFLASDDGSYIVSFIRSHFGSSRFGSIHFGSSGLGSSLVGFRIPWLRAMASAAVLITDALRAPLFLLTPGVAAAPIPQSAAAPVAAAAAPPAAVIAPALSDSNLAALIATAWAAAAAAGPQLLENVGTAEAVALGGLAVPATAFAVVPFVGFMAILQSTPGAATGQAVAPAAAAAKATTAAQAAAVASWARATIAWPFARMRSVAPVMGVATESAHGECGRHVEGDRMARQAVAVAEPWRWTGGRAASSLVSNPACCWRRPAA